MSFIKTKINPKFSVIIPVYNVELYIADTIDCLIGQTIGFEKNCEIIFVDDGSSDDTTKVCKDYAAKYPYNITYVKQKNAGPGAARNRGVKKAKGKYVSMLDSDDLLSSDTFEEVYNFFEKHYDEIDVVGIKMKFFEAKTGDHPLNYKFSEGDRIINLENEHEAILGSAAPSFFKREVFNKHLFDPEVGRYSEDLRFMGEVLMDKMKYGVVSKPTYFYRKRHEQTSSQDGNKTDKFWYLGTPKFALLGLLNYAKSRHREIPKFIQYNVMYELKWRFKQTSQTALTSEELKDYKKQLYDLLDHIGDDAIMAQHDINIALKIFLLSKKHDMDVYKSAERKEDGYYLNSNRLIELNWQREASIDLIEYQDDRLVLHGFTSKPLFSQEKIACKVNGKKHHVTQVDRPHKKITFLGDKVYDFNCFLVSIPISTESEEISFVIENDNSSAEMNIAASRYAGLPFYTRVGSYRKLGQDYLLCHPSPGRLTIMPLTVFRHGMQEIKYDTFLLLSLLVRAVRRVRDHIKYEKDIKTDHTPPGLPAPKTSNKQKTKMRRRADKLVLNTIYSPLVFRVLYHITKPFMREVWLVTDRISAADDNGEVFYKYIMAEEPSRKRKAYFVIDKQTEDYRRIKQYGRVVDFMGFKHKLLTLHAAKVISSEATEFVLNPFFAQGKYLWDLLDYDFVFLQHGIIRDDISSWLNKYSKNISLFITSVKPEYDSVVNGNYGYTSREVALTGLARYDNLQNKPKNKLIIMPTWRQDIVGKPIEGTDERYYNPNFKKSEFFKFWNDLLQDERIAKALKQHKMTAELYLHHGLRSQAKDFSPGLHVQMMDFPYDYPKAKQEGSLLVTDYSSVALDFAYLKKPIIYAQFDIDSYYSTGASNEGYLSYESKGLGPVVYNYEDTIRQIVKYIDSGCVMDSEYQKRTNDFFGYFDNKNSARIYKAIIS